MTKDGGITTFRIRNCRFRISKKKCTLYPIGECPYNGNMAFLKCQKGKDKIIGTVSLADIEKNCERIDAEAREDERKKIGAWLKNETRGVNFGAWAYWWQSVIAKLQSGQAPEGDK